MPSYSINRRQLLQSAGASLVCGITSRTEAASTSNTFSRLFPHLPAFAEPSEALTTALNDIGKPGGIMDAADPLSAGPKNLITDLSLSANNPNAAMPNGAAGTTFLGQFVDHDMTFDTSSVLGVPTDPKKTPNARQPALNLDSLYGDGPAASPQLYDPYDLAKLRIASSGPFEDVPRDGAMNAILGDKRNDEHVVIAGMQAAFIKAHNAIVERVRAGRNKDASQVLARARRLLVWHYQWIVLTEMLPSIIGQQMVNRILGGNTRLFYTPTPGAATIPVEFQGAAYRFGHSMVRPSYRANLAGDNGQPFFAFIFDPAGDGQADPVDLRGGARAARRFVGWQTFFDFGDGEVKPRKIIDTRLSTPLFQLPLSAIASGQPPVVLAQRNLLRQVTWSMPAGQRIAKLMGVTPLTASDFSELAGYGLGLERSTPLWYYVLREAFSVTEGQALGPVGGRIVGEVIIGLMGADPGSWVRVLPRWRPTLPSRNGRGNFDMVDLLTLAGVDPASRGQ